MDFLSGSVDEKISFENYWKIVKMLDFFLTFFALIGNNAEYLWNYEWYQQ